MRFAGGIAGTGVLLIVFALTGCSSNKIAQGVASANSTNIKRIGNLYGSYLVHNGWQGPKNAEDLKRYMHDNLGPKKLEMMGIDSQNVDTIFISERDGKPFKIRWGLTVPALSVVMVAFEEAGEDGRKQVANTNGEVREVDDAEYQGLWGEKAAAPAPAGPPASDKSGDAAAKQSDKK